MDTISSAKTRKSKYDWYLKSGGFVYKDVWDALSKRRKEVIFWRLMGVPERDIARRMGITHRAVWGYRIYAWRLYMWYKEMYEYEEDYPTMIEVLDTEEFRTWRREVYEVQRTAV